MKIGLDIGGSHIAIGMVNNDNKIILKKEKDIKISKAKNPNKTLQDNMIALIEDMINKFQNEKIELIGLAFPRLY